MIDGIGAEIYMGKLITQLHSTFQKKELKFTNQELLRLVAKHDFIKLESLMKVMNEASVLALAENSQSWLLDRLFCTDFLVQTEIEDEDGNYNLVTVSIDVTADPEKVIAKESKFHSAQNLLQAIGVDYCLVVAVITEQPTKRDLAVMYQQATKVIELLQLMQLKGNWVGSLSI